MGHVGFTILVSLGRQLQTPHWRSAGSGLEHRGWGQVRLSAAS